MTGFLTSRQFVRAANATLHAGDGRAAGYSLHGYSLFELLITLAIVASLAAAAANLSQLVRNTSRVAEINMFVGYLALARSEAIKRGHKTVLCPSSNGKQCETGTDFTWWHHGLLLFADVDGDGNFDPTDSVIRVHVPASPNLQIKTSRSRARVTFQSDGSAGGTNLTFTFCDISSGAKPRYVVVSNTGRARISDTPADGRADDPVEQCS